MVAFLSTLDDILYFFDAFDPAVQAGGRVVLGGALTATLDPAAPSQMRMVIDGPLPDLELTFRADGGRLVNEADIVAEYGPALIVSGDVGGPYTVENDGLIEGVDGLRVYAGDARIENRGTVRAISAGGPGDGYGLYGRSRDGVSILNTGEIQGDPIAVWLRDGDDVLTNEGELIGFAYLGAGDDVYHGENGVLRRSIWGGDGDDLIFRGAGDDQRYSHGRNGKDVFHGHDGRDSFNGGGQDDTAYGGAWDDVLRGQTGDDTLYGGSGGDGADRLEGGGGDNTLDGGLGDDRLIGGASNDVFYGGDGDDKTWGDAGIDNVWGGDGDDRILGGSGDDSLIGGNGEDVILGGTGNDFIRGKNGVDTLNGQAGDDTLYGDYGDDLLVTTSGNDYLHGGGGVDTIRVMPGAGDAFSPAMEWGEFGTPPEKQDILDLSFYSFGSFEEVLEIASNAVFVLPYHGPFDHILFDMTDLGGGTFRTPGNLDHLDPWNVLW